MIVSALLAALPGAALMSAAAAPTEASAATTPSAAVSGVASCEADGTYSITWTVQTTDIPEGEEGEVKVITPENAWLYEWAQHYANHRLPALPPNAAFTWVQTGISGTTTTAHVTFQIDWHSYSHDPEGQLTLTGDCSTPPPPPADVLPENKTTSVDDTSCSTGLVTTTTTITSYSWSTSTTSKAVAVGVDSTTTSTRAVTALECPPPPVEPPVVPDPPVLPPVPPVPPVTPEPPVTPPITPEPPASPPVAPTPPVTTLAHNGVVTASPARQQLASTGADARLLGVAGLLLLTAGAMTATAAVVRRARLR